MFRNLKRKTEAALRRRKNNKSLDNNFGTPISWPLQENRPPSYTEGENFFIAPTPPPEELDEEELRHRQQFRFTEPDTQTETVVNEETPAPEPESELEPEQEEDEDDEGDGDRYVKTYVPFVETSAMKSNRFVQAASSHYGIVSAAIMDGFGGDDESIWLVDDEETDEEAENAPKTHDEDESTEPPVVQQQQQQQQQEEEEEGWEGEEDKQPPPVVETPDPAPQDTQRAAFKYRVNLALFDDEEFTTTSPGETIETSVATDATSISDPVSPISSLGYAPEALDKFISFDPETEHEHEHETQETDETLITSPSLSTTSNPYVAFLEQQESAMTAAYLRRLDLSERRGDEVADEFRFGQRYQKDRDTSDVFVTHQRVPSDHKTGDRDCCICVESKEVLFFPRFSVTASCTHPPSTCLECLETSIKSDLSSKLWTDIRCPECRELLDYTDIQRYADPETFRRYENLALRAAMSEAENFFWCTSGCGSGQIHDSGAAQPIVTCLHCNHRSCFHHTVSWHQGLTCEEYDQLLADPDNFRSKLEVDNEAWAAAQQAQLDADRAMARGLLLEEERERERRQEREREERERTRKALELARRVAARRKMEEEMSRVTVGKTTKPCPGCGWAIEKNEGCSHMTCAKCKHEFCYECGADHKQIMQTDNSVHEENCPFHPSQLKDSGEEEEEEEENEKVDNDDDDVNDDENDEDEKEEEEEEW